MPGRINCAGCGARINLPEGFAKARIRCESCGYYSDVPANLRDTVGAVDSDSPPAKTKSAKATEPATPEAKKKPKVKERFDPRDKRPSFETDEPAGPNLLEGTQTEDDDMPYAVPGQGVMPCPYCKQELPLDAGLCVHCGRDLESGKEHKRREFDTVDRTWEATAPLKTRLILLGALQVVNLILIGLTFSVGSDTGAFGAVGFLVVQGALQAFLIGTYETLTVKRSKKGSAQVLHQWRIAFVPKPPTKVAWKVSEGVGIIASHNPGILEWGTFVYLVLLGCLPGILFWYVVIRPERFQLALCDVHGSTDGIFFRTTNRDEAEEIGKCIAGATGLLFRPVL